MQEYMSVQEAAALWQISDRRVTVLCKGGRIPGAEKVGKSWKIPADTVKPSDHRMRGEKEANGGNVVHRPAVKRASVPVSSAEIVPAVEENKKPEEPVTDEQAGPQPESSMVAAEASIAEVPAPVVPKEKKPIRRKPRILPPPVGISSYRRIAEECCLVDQSLMIRELLEHPSAVTLITRPEGFGKSLMMDMLRCFFDVRTVDAQHLFNDKKVARDAEWCLEHQNRYPVIAISLKNVLFETFEKSVECIQNILRNLYMEHKDSFTVENCTEWELDYTGRILHGELSQVELTQALGVLSGILHRSYGYPPILLMDDYDTPIRSGYHYGYAGDAVNFLRNLLVSVCKDNEHLFFGVIFGIMDLTTDPAFEELNRWVKHTLEEETPQDYLGFGEADVQKIAAYYHLEESMEELCSWCGGYGFGDGQAYRPASVMEFMAAAGKPQTQDLRSEALRAILRQIIRRKDLRMLWQLEALIKGEAVPVKAEAQELENDLNWEDSAAIYEQLIHMGYLKAQMSMELTDGGHLCHVFLPNDECRMAMKRQVLRRFRNMVGGNLLSELQEACYKKDPEAIGDVIRRILLQAVDTEAAEGADVYEKLNSTDEVFLPCLLLGLRTAVGDFYQVDYDRDAAGTVIRILLQTEEKNLPTLILQIHRIRDNSAELIKRQAKNNLRQMQSVYGRRKWQQRLGVGIGYYSMVYNGEKVCLLQEVR